MSSPSLRDPRLALLYQRTPGTIAFVDESYRPQPRGGGAPFYSMSAVILAKDQLDHVREVLTDIAGSLYWHTTEAHEDGRASEITRMNRFLARETQWNVLTVDIPLAESNGAVERARSICLAAITREVTRGTGPNAVRLIVADRNRDEALNRSDQATVAQLRSLGDVDPNVALYHGRMGREPVLWAADTVSWSAYRNLSVDDGRWIEPLRDVLTVLDARTGRPVDMKQPQAAAAPGAVAPSPGAPQTTGAQVRGQSAVASTSSLGGARSEMPDGAQPYRRGSTVLYDLVARIAQVRRAAGSGGIVEGNTPEALAARARRLTAPDPTTPLDHPTPGPTRKPQQ
ncbi:hypothetical protein [Actinotalea sp. K2]|uniref:hypothetical protein n=1 Tax=Actinotalea sp. K2 TaxID=2939438 RepID=UPI002017ABC4|nr:hypothetical protein [Actinotalea sp. K2]MCL3862981.1 hypothetical protein [Actinotalea sp. K2]